MGLDAPIKSPSARKTSSPNALQPQLPLFRSSRETSNAAPGKTVLSDDFSINSALQHGAEAVGVGVGVKVAVGGIEVGVDVGVKVAVGVAVAVGVDVEIGVEVGVNVGGKS